MHTAPAVRTGELTPDHSSPDMDAGSVTDVDRGFVATTMTPSQLASVIGEVSGRAVRAIELAPTPRVEISAGLVRERAPMVARILGGRYRLGRQLGAGGYGAVYAAEDTVTGERVAIKVLSPAASQNQELIIRFHREAIAASRARHPHIINIVDFDADEDDGHFIVMEQLDGRDLAQTLAGAQRLSPVRALTIAAQCARGLAAAHRVGVLHRDLKPANVFLVKRDGGGESVKVIDFGISKLTPLAGDYTDVTSGSKVVGTPSYMSPEQARGAQLDARTDVYALGVMLFEMLVGERPFTGRSPIEILGNHISAPRIAPSALRPELAECAGLDALVLRALAPQPDQRFASMESLGDALVACLRSIAPEAAEHVTEITGEQRDRVTSRVSRTRLRPRWIAAAIIVIAATVAVVASVLHEPQSSRRVVAEPIVPTAPAVVAAPTPSPPVASPATTRDVLITSKPRGAVVYRGGQRVGITPLTLTLDSAAEITVEAVGYRSRRVTVGVDRSQLNIVMSAIRTPKPTSTSTTRGVAEW